MDLSVLMRESSLTAPAESDPISQLRWEEGGRDAAMKVAGTYPRYARQIITDAAHSMPKRANTHASDSRDGSRPHAYSSTSSTLGSTPRMLGSWHTRDTVSVNLMPVPHPWGLSTVTVTQ